MTSCLTVVFVLLQVLVASKLSHGKYLRDIDIKEFQDLAGSTSGSFVAVYFDNAASRKNYPFFLKEFRKAVEPIDKYGIELLRLNCKGLDNVQECRETNVYTYRNGIQEDSFGLELLFDYHSIMSNILSSLIKHEVEHVSETERVKEIIQGAKLHNKIVVFAYVKGFGTVDHATFIKIAYVFSDAGQKFEFVITTDTTVADKIKGLSLGGFLAVHYCKGIPYESDEPCRVFTPLKKKTVQIAQLLELLQQPKYDYLLENGTSTYDGLTLSVNKAYIFTRDTNKFSKEELDKFADEFFGYVGIVIVDIKKHKDQLSKFGLSMKSKFPTGAYVPAGAPRDTKEPNVELYPDKSVLFTLDNFKHLLREYLRNPTKQYKIDATMLSVQTLPFSEFSTITSKSLLPGSFLLAAFCEKDVLRSECRDFNRHFRRVVRTYDRSDVINVNFIHVILSNDGDTEIGTTDRPHIRFWSSDSGEKYEVFKGTPDYNGLLNFLEERTKISVTRLPPSNSEELHDNGSDGNVEEEKNDQDEQAATDERPGDDEAPPEEVEDDEVAGAVWHSEAPTVPEDQVPSLTDKTFQPTRDGSDLLVVKFFQPWDARSRAFIGPYIEAAQSLGNFDVGKFNIRLARVNCFDWTDVCQNNNITTYPTIKLYRKGLDEFIYKGPLDSDNIIKTVLLLQNESPLKIESENQVNLFLTGKLPSNSDKTGQVSVLGLFPGNDGQEFKAFKEAASQLRGSFMFGFVSGKSAQSIAAAYGIKAPGILLIKRNDAIRPRVVFSGDFSPSNIVDFVRVNSLKSFGELTPMNLPLYHKHGRPLVIAFRASAVDNDVYSPILEKIADDESLHDKVFFTWIALSSNDVNEVILQSYTHKNDVPVLVIVNKKMGLVYQFKKQPTVQEVTDWVKRCLSGEENPSSRLKDGKWEPLLEGYDYLAMMDKEEEEEGKKSDDMLGEYELGLGEGTPEESTGPPVIEKKRLRQPVDFREDDEKQHDEL